MKKLMMAAAIVCAAVAAQAATVNWYEQAAVIRNGTAANVNVADGTLVYLIQNSAHSASDVVSGFVAGTLTAATIQGYAQDITTEIDTGKFDASNDNVSLFTAGDAEQAYYVMFNGKNMFVSEIINAGYDSMGSTGGTYTFEFGDVKALSKELPVTTDYAGAHWYTAVPEPTSGLLLLLGVAGLALRRRRA